MDFEFAFKLSDELFKLNWDETDKMVIPEKYLNMPIHLALELADKDMNFRAINDILLYNRTKEEFEKETNMNRYLWLCIHIKYSDSIFKYNFLRHKYMESISDDIKVFTSKLIPYRQISSLKKSN